MDLLDYYSMISWKYDGCTVNECNL